jgi:hypothetical protein
MCARIHARRVARELSLSHSGVRPRRHKHSRMYEYSFVAHASLPSPPWPPCQVLPDVGRKAACPSATAAAVEAAVAAVEAAARESKRNGQGINGTRKTERKNCKREGGLQSVPLDCRDQRRTLGRKGARRREGRDERPSEDRIEKERRKEEQ